MTTGDRLKDERENLKADAQKDPRELEREADRARAEVEHTLEALERRLSPGELLDQALRMVKGGGGGFATHLADQVRNNPMPTLLTGVGLTWLMMASDRPPPRYVGGSGTGMGSSTGLGSSTGSGMGSAIGDKASGAASAASHAASSARTAVGSASERTRAAAERGRAAAENAAHRAQEMGRGFADASRSGARSAWEGYDYLRREQPLVLGALAVAAGALIGGLLPRTEAEDRYVGEYSDEATERLKQEAQHQAEQAREKAASAAEAATREAREPARTGGTSQGATAETGTSSGPASGSTTGTKV